MAPLDNPAGHASSPTRRFLTVAFVVAGLGLAAVGLSVPAADEAPAAPPPGEATPAEEAAFDAIARLPRDAHAARVAGCDAYLRVPAFQKYRGVVARLRAYHAAHAPLAVALVEVRVDLARHPDWRPYFKEPRWRFQLKVTRGAVPQIRTLDRRDLIEPDAGVIRWAPPTPRRFVVSPETRYAALRVELVARVARAPTERALLVAELPALPPGSTHTLFSGGPAPDLGGWWAVFRPADRAGETSPVAP